MWTRRQRQMCIRDRTYGDIDTFEIGEVISSRAPFPGGVGPITVSALFFNLSRLIQTN